MNHAAARVLILIVSLWLAAAAPHKSWQGSWSATSGSTTFGGTWDAELGDDPDSASGSWTLMDQSGATLADGTWAARKDRNVWRGMWQARGRSGRVYSGSWRAQSGLPASARFSDMFESALTKMASGTWRMGTYSGGWSIRAYPSR